MRNFEDGAPVFDAALQLTRREISGAQLARTLVAYPFMTLKVLAAIYRQALALRLKRIPFHTNPRKIAHVGSN